MPLLYKLMSTVNTKLTSKVPFFVALNFQGFLKNLVKNVQFRYATTGKFFLLPSPRRQYFRENFLGARFDTLKCLEAGAPPPIFWCFLRPWLMSVISGHDVLKINEYTFPLGYDYIFNLKKLYVSQAAKKLKVEVKSVM